MVSVKLENYEGPLDVLYELIEKNQINIYDIPIALLTEQYIAFLEIAEYKDMDSMSEFVLMAATLLEIKSKMLLPRAKTEEEADPRENLVAKLIEYKMFKDISIELKEKQEEAAKVFFRELDITMQSLAEQESKNNQSLADFLNGVTFEKLYNSFEDVVKRKELKIDKIRSTFNKIERDIYTIENKIVYIKDMLIIYGKVTFSKIFSDDTSKIEVVVTFLALLELIKRREILIWQAGIFDEIEITSLAKELT